MYQPTLPAHAGFGLFAVTLVHLSHILDHEPCLLSSLVLVLFVYISIKINFVLYVY